MILLWFWFGRSPGPAHSKMKNFRTTTPVGFHDVDESSSQCSLDQSMAARWKEWVRGHEGDGFPHVIALPRLGHEANALMCDVMQSQKSAEHCPCQSPKYERPPS